MVDDVPVEQPPTEDTHPFFTSPEADITLQTSDGVEYRVFRCILSLASSFFRAMFILPTGGQEQQESSVIPIAEPSAIMEPLLKFLYPMPDPVVDSLDDLNDLITTAIKYELLGPLHTLRALLVSPKFTNVDPFRCFTIAVRHQLTEEISTTAGHTFNISLLDMPVTEDHKHLTGYEFFKLLKLHQRRSKEAQDIIKVGRSQFRCPGCYRRTSPGSSIWWNDWEARACEELKRRPSTKIIFSPSFIAKSAKAASENTSSFNAAGVVTRCTDCPFDILNSQQGLESLKAKIDSLPVVL